MNRVLEHQGPNRTLRYALAIAIITLSVVLGLIYQSLWGKAGEDISQLLPANTKLYLQLKEPTTYLNRAAQLHPELSLWGQSPRTPRHIPLLKRLVHDWAGLRPELAQDLIRNARSIELALVPTSQGPATLLFFKIEESFERKRLLTRLRPHLTLHERHTGFRIDRVQRPLWDQLTEPYLRSPSILEMEPWLIFSWGSITSLHDLLNARVGGRHDAIARRSGFIDTQAPSAQAPFRLSTDALSAYELLAGEPLNGPSLWEYLDLITLESTFAPQGKEHLSLSLTLSDSDFIARLHRVLNGTTHTQLSTLPDDSPFALSLSSLRVGQLLGLLEEVSPRLRIQHHAQPVFGQLLHRLSSFQELLSDQAGELLFIAHHEEDFGGLISLRTASGMALESAFSDALIEHFADEVAVGEVYLDDQTIHMTRTHRGELDLVWRRRDDTFEFAHHVMALEHRNQHGLRPIALDLFGSSHMNQAPLRFLYFPARDEITGDGVSRFAFLAPLLNSPLAFSASMHEDHLKVESPIGVWSLLLAALSASEESLNQLELQQLKPECQTFYRSFCEAFPASYPCQQLHYHMRLLVAQMCRQNGIEP